MKAVVRLSHPASMDLVLRKRLAVNIYKKQSLTSKFVKSIIGSVNTMYETGIMYEVVSNIPKVMLLYFLIVISRCLKCHEFTKMFTPDTQ